VTASVVLIAADLGCSGQAHSAAGLRITDRPVAPPPPTPLPSPLARTRPFQHTAAAISDPDSVWVVVDKARPLVPIDYAPRGLESVGNGQFMRSEAANQLIRMFAAAAAAGHQLTADSGYRSYAHQQTVFAREVAGSGLAQAVEASARAGYSEHQTGWAVDIGGDGCEIATCFGATPAGRWAAAQAYRFGFLLRYPQGLEAVTGFMYEPWHFRYVGTTLAAAMHQRRVLTLEQAFWLPSAPAYTAD
jgi:D-alanyl-D-alanine carboxypeptidase